MRDWKGIIFDLDGVICSTDEYHYQAWKALADRLGIDFDRERNNQLRGVSRMASLDILLGDRGGVYTDRAKQEMAEEKNDLYREMLGRMSPLDLEKEVPTKPLAFHKCRPVVFPENDCFCILLG